MTIIEKIIMSVYIIANVIFIWGIVIKNDNMFEIGAVLMVISLICMALNFIWFSC